MKTLIGYFEEPLKKGLIKVLYINEKGHSGHKVAQQHIKGIIEEGGNIVRTYDDGAFDVKEFFNFLERYRIDSAIRIRSNASTKEKGSMRRKKEVLKFKELGYKGWAGQKEYGLRWPLTEDHFSGIKRCYGDCARSKLISNIFLELKRKVWIDDKVRKYGGATNLGRGGLH